MSFAVDQCEREKERKEGRVEVSKWRREVNGDGEGSEVGECKKV